VLLVGGASRRFGSPKALARLEGRTLAEHAWALLGEACEERIAVGKLADRLALPFPLLDDGTEVRAPIAGVVAGLHAARHDVSVVVPVDCPRLTPGAVRALGEAAAVPQTGPLPGAYAKAMLPQLEERLAAGELSLRGVNGTEMELDERLLANVNTAADLAALERPGHALVVGGTGMLAGLTRALRHRGHPVTFLARRGVDLGGGIVQVAVDYRDDRALTDGLADAVDDRGPIELAVAWVHSDARAAPATVAAAVAPGGRLFQVFGTRVWPLDPVPLHVAYRRVLLGSAGGRWLTHDEIADGVLRAIDGDRPLAIVGERDIASTGTKS
jgi:molybdopterin-guanine dinucleotide biosynthesis protein A